VRASGSGTRLALATAAMCVTLSSVALLTACSGSSAAPQSALPTSSNAKLDAGRVLVESKCKMCHTLDRIKAATHDQAGWQSTVARMRSKGAVLTDAEAQSVIAYLSGK
jgi:cytochrome c5